MHNDFPLRMHDFSLHDPFLLADGRTGMYYLYNANYYQYQSAEHGFGKSVVMYTSPDLKHFSKPVSVFDVVDRPADAWYDDCDSPWAPEVHEWRGRYWMFVTLHARRDTPAHPDAGPAWYRRDSTFGERRGVFVLVADTPDGPFMPVHPQSPATPSDVMALDGTLAIDADGSPWMIYAHEWVQLFDGTMEAMRLDASDLSVARSEPSHLWYASEGVWHVTDGDAPQGGWQGDFDAARASRLLVEGSDGYVTDGPYAIRTPSGALVCLWTSYSAGQYILTQAISDSGTIRGPWRQLAPLDFHDAGHAMVFRSLDGQPLLLMHTNMTRKTPDGRDLVSHGIVYNVEITDGGVRLGRHRADIDGIADIDNDI